MASVLVLAFTSDGIPLAIRLAQEGHIVKVHTKTKAQFEGANPSLVNSPLRLLEQFDLVVVGSGFGQLADECREQGKLVIGGGIFSDKLHDEDYLVRVHQAVFPEAFCEGGIDVAVHGWFNGEDWTQPFAASVDQFRFMENNKGVWTSGMGSSMWLIENNKLVSWALQPLVRLLVKVRYIGPVSVTCRVDEGNLAPIALCAGFSYPLYAYMELVRTTCFDLLYSVASKNGQQAQGLNGDLALAVRLSIPPWPYEGNDTLKVSIPPEAKKHIWEQYSDGVLCCVTARGNNLREARRRVYRTVSNIADDPSIQYRSDIGEDVETVQAQLKKWGWLDGPY